MKRLLAAVLVLILVFSCTGCAESPASAGAAGDDDTLIVFNYSEYMDPEVIEQFTKETGIKIKYEEAVTAEEMYTKYKAGALK